MIKKVYTILTSITLLLGMTTIPVVAETNTTETDESIVKLDDISCRKLLKLKDSEQEAAMMFFHGYMSGQKADLVANIDTLADVTDKVIDECIDNPDAKLMNMFKKYRL
jgi:hypothetical protein